MTDALRWTLYPAAAFAAHAQFWDDLNAATFATPLLDSRLIACALEFFPAANLSLALASDARGPATACLVERRGPFLAQTFSPAQLPLCVWLQRPDLALPTLLRRLLHALPYGMGLLSLTAVDPLFLPPPPAEARIRTRPHFRTGQISLSGSFAGYEAQRPKLLLRNHRRRGSAAAALGDITLEMVAAADQIALALEQFAALECAGWKGGAGTAIQANSSQYHFYVQTLQQLCASGEARIAILRIGPQVAAMQLALVRGAQLYCLKSTYDENLAQLGPGVLLKWWLLKAGQSATPKILTYEMYGRVSESQRPLLSSTRQIFHLNYFRWRVTASAYDHWQRRKARAQAHQRDNSEQNFTLSAALPPLPEAARARHLSDPIFGSLPWFDLLHRTTLATDVPLLVLTPPAAERGPAYCLPLHPVRSRWLSGIQGLANFYSPLFQPLIPPAAAQSAAIAFSSFLRRQARAIDFVDLHPLDAEGLFYTQAPTALRAAGFLVDTHGAAVNWILEVRGRSFDEYFVGLPARLRNTYRRAHKALTREQFNLQILTQPSPELDAAILTFEAIYVGRWRAQAEPHPCFIRELCLLAARMGWRRPGLLQSNGVAIAAQIWLVQKGTASIFKLAHLQTFSQRSAGTVLLAEMLRAAITVDKVTLVDFLTGDDAFKADWMSHRRERCGVIGFNLRRPMGLALAARHFAGKLWRPLRTRLRPRGEAPRPTPNRPVRSRPAAKQ